MSSYIPRYCLKKIRSVYTLANAARNDQEVRIPSPEAMTQREPHSAQTYPWHSLTHEREGWTYSSTILNPIYMHNAHDDDDLRYSLHIKDQPCSLAVAGASETAL